MHQLYCSTLHLKLVDLIILNQTLILCVAHFLLIIHTIQFINTDCMATQIGFNVFITFFFISKVLYIVHKSIINNLA